MTHRKRLALGGQWVRVQRLFALVEADMTREECLMAQYRLCVGTMGASPWAPLVTCCEPFGVWPGVGQLYRMDVRYLEDAE